MCPTSSHLRYCVEDEPHPLLGSVVPFLKVALAAIERCRTAVNSEDGVKAIDLVLTFCILHATSNQAGQPATDSYNRGLRFHDVGQR